MGTWVAQAVEHPTLTQVMISQFVSSSPAWGSVLAAQGLEPALDSVCPSLSAPPPFMLSLFLSLKNKIKTLKKIIIKGLVAHRLHLQLKSWENLLKP